VCGHASHTSMVVLATNARESRDYVDAKHCEG
jgi:hypothetical protein